jgi:hypothetical protein
MRTQGISHSVPLGRNAQPGPSPKVREARFDDYAEIMNLQSRYDLGRESYEEWSHLWTGNPLYKELPKWPIGWVLETEEQEIVGYAGNIPLSYQFRGKRIVAATFRAWVVDSNHRSHALSLLGRYFQQKNVDLFINTTVSKYAVCGQEAFRASRVPAGAWDKSVFWITENRGFTSSFLARKGFLASKLLKFPIELCLLAEENLAKRNSRLDSQEVSISFCTNFDARFDALWKELRRSNPEILLATRSREMLEWRFERALAENRSWVLTVEEGPQLAAYAIFLRRDKPELSLKRLRLIDFQALNGRNELLLPILVRALERCRSEGIHMLDAIGFGPKKQRILDSIEPHRRTLSSWLYYYKARDKHLANSLTDPSCWDPSCFDGDASL